MINEFKMINPEKLGHLHLVYHFTVPVREKFGHLHLVCHFTVPLRGSRQKLVNENLDIELEHTSIKHN